MNLLYEPFPETVTVGGKPYPIYTDFRDWLRFFDLQEEEKLSRQDKLLMMLGWYKEMPPVALAEEALLALIDFAANAERKQKKQTAAPQSSEKVLSWNYDAPYIYAAFLSVYRIDLLNVEYMHWHTFLALFNGLPEDVPLKKRIGYRSINTAEIKDKERKKQLLKIKNSVRIPQKPMDAQATGEFFG